MHTRAERKMLPKGSPHAARRLALRALNTVFIIERGGMGMCRLVFHAIMTCILGYYVLRSE